MNIAFLHESSRANYAEDILLAGFRGLFGPDCQWTNVQKSHLTRYEREPQAPEASCWMGIPAVSRLDAMGLACAMDLLVVGNPNEEGFAGAAESLIGIAKEAGVPVIGLDGDDIPHLDTLEALLPEGPWFLRECRHQDLADPRIVPCFFSLNTLVAPKPKSWNERDIDLLWCGIARPNRIPYLIALSEFAASRPDLKIEIRNGRDLSFDDFNSLLCRSKTCLCLVGAGRGTYRYLECGGAGVVPIIQDHELIIVDDYVDLAAPRFRTPSEMILTIERTLTNQKPLKHMAEEAYQTVWGSHTMTVRAAQVISECEKRRIF